MLFIYFFAKDIKKHTFFCHSYLYLHYSFFFSLPECDQYYFLHEGKCVDDCPEGYFASEQQQECVRCHADCASCDGPGFDDCDVCHNLKAVRYNGECLPQCPSNTYYDKTTNECRGREGGSCCCFFCSHKTK